MTSNHYYFVNPSIEILNPYEIRFLQQLLALRACHFCRKQEVEMFNLLRRNEI